MKCKGVAGNRPPLGLLNGLVLQKTLCFFGGKHCASGLGQLTNCAKTDVVLDTAICRHPVQRLSCHPLHSHLAMLIGAMWTANPDQVPRNSGSFTGFLRPCRKPDIASDSISNSRRASAIRNRIARN